MNRSLSLLGLTATLFLFSQSAMAWEYFLSPPTYAEGPLKWYETDGNPATARVTVYVDSTGLSSIGDGDNGVTATIGALQAWNGGGLDTLISGVPSISPPFNVVDGVSTLHFSDPSGACSYPCLALTIVTHYDSGDVASGIVDIEHCNGTDYLPFYDVSIVTNNSALFSWTSEAEDPGLVGCSNEYYVEAVMSHETGHLLGLGHENDVAPEQALMYESLAACDQKTLQYDDLRGRDVIYACDGECAVSAPPNAQFSYGTNGLTASFTDQSSDSDGSVVSWSWNFGDGNTSSAQDPVHTYSAGGSYSVMLTVTDDSGLTDSATQSVSVSNTGGISLSGTGYKVRGVQHADLQWSGAASSVEILRDGSLLTTVTGTTYTDVIGNKGGGSYSYKVCNAGTTICSDPVVVSF